MNVILRILYVLFIGVILSSCNTSDNETISRIKDEEIKAEPVELEWQFLNTDLRNLRQQNNIKAYPGLRNKYGTFFDLYTLRLINIGKAGNEKFEFYLTDFLTNTTIMQVFDSTEKEFGNMTAYREPFNEAFTRYRNYFPKKTPPRVVTFVSGFNYGVVATDSVLGIGLDMFLGKNCKFYEYLNVPRFMLSGMNPYDILPTAIKGWINTEFETDRKNSTLIDDMIYEGKLLYALDALLPDVADSVKIHYTTSQMNWALQNEAQAWKYLVEHKLLFNTNHLEKRKLTGEAPFTTGMPKESPGRMGQYIGWQIVRKYMNKQKEINLESLLRDNDTQKILNQSGYKPK